MTKAANDSKAAANVAASRKQAQEQTAEAVEANSGLKAPTGAKLGDAQAEGVTEAIKENAKDTYNYLTDGQQLGAEPARQFFGKSDIMQFEPFLALGVEAFEAAVADRADDPIPEEKVAGLLELERSGQNRTPYVKAMCRRLKVKSPYEVTAAGPGYTNPVQLLDTL